MSFKAAICCLSLCLFAAACSSNLGDDANQIGKPATDPSGSNSDNLSDSVDWSVPPLNLPEGTQIAKLGVEVPDADFFILRGTLPVPKALFPRADGKIPFAVKDFDNTLVPAQAEIVSRYANDDYGADVVELIAWVRRNPQVAPGTFREYPVVVSYYAPPAPVGGSAASRLLQTYAIPATLQGLLTSGGPLKVRAQDYYNNKYEVDLLAAEGSLRQVRQGLNANQVVTYGTMMPVAGNPQSTKQLAHLFGVHAYLTTWSGEETVSIDLRINNAPTNRSPGNLDNPLGDVYFKNIELVIPQGWTMRQQAVDPFFRGAYNEGNARIVPLVDSIKDNDDQTYHYKVINSQTGKTEIVTTVLDYQSGQMHHIPERFHFHRRLALTGIGNEAAADRILSGYGVSFARAGSNVEGKNLYSWWNVDNGGYFAQKQLLPSSDSIGGNYVINALKDRYEQYLYHLESGTQTPPDSLSPFSSTAFGAFQMFGAAYQGETGGGYLGYYQGADVLATASRHGLLALQLGHRCNDNRQPSALYNEDGTPILRGDWEKPGIVTPTYMNFDFYMGPQGQDPFGYSTATNPQIATVQVAGKQPPYEGPLKSYQAHDGQHLRRYTRNPLALVWIINDALSKDDLWMQAELLYVTHREISKSATQLAAQSTMLLQQAMDVYGLSGAQVVPADLSTLTAKPIGFGAGREHGWGLDTLAAYYALAPLEWRAARAYWYRFAVDVYSDGQSICSGLLGRKVNSKVVGGLYQGTQMYEEQIMINGLNGVYKSVFEFVDAERMLKLKKIITTSVYAMTTTAIWSSAKNGPQNQWAVAELDSEQPYYLGGGTMPPQCSPPPAGGIATSGEVFKGYAWPIYAHSFALTGDKFFLQRAAESLGVSGNPATMSLSQLAAAMSAKFKSESTTYNGFNDLDNRVPLIAIAELF